MKKINKFGHIINGDVNVRKLWIAREIIVKALNRLEMISLIRQKQKTKEITKIREELKLGLNKVNKFLGVRKN